MLVTGDPVNVAKRLEEAARTGEILIGDGTRRLVENAALLEPRDELTVKGKSGPVIAWNVLGVIEGAPAYARRLDAPLVGRTDELRLLQKAFATAVSKRACRLVTVVGPAGIGKSRLAAELCHGVERCAYARRRAASRTATASRSGRSSRSSARSAATRASANSSPTREDWELVASEY